MSGPIFRSARLVPLLQVMAERGGQARLGDLKPLLRWDTRVLVKTLENARARDYARHDGKHWLDERTWTLTRAGWAKVGMEPPAEPAAPPPPQPPRAWADDGVPRVVSAEQARPWAVAATGGTAAAHAEPEPGPQTEPAEPAEPELLVSIDAALVRGLPVFEVDIDRVHRRRAPAAPAECSVAAGGGAALPFVCALYSDGVLSIESHGRHLELPADHARQLLSYLAPHMPRGGAQ